VSEREKNGQAVYLVDSFAVIDPQREMADAAHPNDAGYERIGEAFADVLLPILGVERLD
jgi:lysophospholipase L1-like esterase